MIVTAHQKFLHHQMIMVSLFLSNKKLLYCLFVLILLFTIFSGIFDFEKGKSTAHKRTSNEEENSKSM
jgi:hypothetical protein